VVFAKNELGVGRVLAAVVLHNVDESTLPNSGLAHRASGMTLRKPAQNALPAVQVPTERHNRAAESFFQAYVALELA
jgi:hypothetical protein